jgi:periplasmic protein TonB
MFDRLVETTKQKNGRRARRYFVVMGVIYALGLGGFGVATVLTFSPVLAEEYALIGLLPPPVPFTPQPAPLINPISKPAPEARFVPLEKPPAIPPAGDAAKFPTLNPSQPSVIGAPYRIRNPVGNGVLVGFKDTDSVPPPPLLTPKPTPKAEPTATPEPPREAVVRSEGVLQGSAIRKVTPLYPTMGKQVKAAGTVQVQVTISEQGRVIDAAVLNGHPLLRNAALEAAKEWVFTPTRLNNTPVKVQGVLSFNFKLD